MAKAAMMRATMNMRVNGNWEVPVGQAPAFHTGAASAASVYASLMPMPLPVNLPEAGAGIAAGRFASANKPC